MDATARVPVPPSSTALPFAGGHWRWQPWSMAPDVYETTTTSISSPIEANTLPTCFHFLGLDVVLVSAEPSPKS
jgi:hypothetical protein